MEWRMCASEPDSKPEGEWRSLSKWNCVHQLRTLHLNSSYLSMSCPDGVKIPRMPVGEFCSIRYKGNFAFSWRNPLTS